MVRAFAGRHDKEKRGRHMALWRMREVREGGTIVLAKPIGLVFSFLTVDAELWSFGVYKTAEIYRIPGPITKKPRAKMLKSLNHNA
jgi:hypothetical protein